MALQAYFTDLKQNFLGFKPYISQQKKQTNKQANKSNRLKQTWFTETTALVLCVNNEGLIKTNPFSLLTKSSKQNVYELTLLS